MCIQFTVFLCKLNSAPCPRYKAVSNYGIMGCVFPWHPCPRCSYRTGRAQRGKWRWPVVYVGPLPCMARDPERRERGELWKTRKGKVMVKEMGVLLRFCRRVRVGVGFVALPAQLVPLFPGSQSEGWFTDVWCAPAADGLTGSGTSNM